MTLIDIGFLKEVAPDVIMKKMASFMSVRGIRPGKHSSVDYATINIYFLRNKRRTTTICQEVHIVDGLKAKMLIGIDILGRESFTIDTGNKKQQLKATTMLSFA